MKEKILSILKEIDADKDFEANESLVTNGILTSLDIIQLISDLSDTFEIRIPASEIIPDNFNSITRIEKMICRLQEED